MVWVAEFVAQLQSLSHSCRVCPRPRLIRPYSGANIISQGKFTLWGMHYFCLQLTACTFVLHSIDCLNQPCFTATLLVLQVTWIIWDGWFQQSVFIDKIQSGTLLHIMTHNDNLCYQILSSKEMPIFYPMFIIHLCQICICSDYVTLSNHFHNGNRKA